MVWWLLGEGAYNKAYVNDDSTLVFKIQKKKNDTTDTYDTPERSIRLMTELYPDMPLGAQLHEDPQLGKGWTFPFIHGRPAKDLEMVKVIIDIFNRTGRIMLDGCINRNFITTYSNHPTYPNKIFCIDVGMTVRLQAEEEIMVSGKSRRKSQTSHNIQRNEEIGLYYKSWSHSTTKDLIATHLIQALLLIREHRPSIVDVSFLKDNSAFIKKLGFLYQKNLELTILKANKELSPEEQALALLEFKKLPERTDAALRELDAMIAEAEARTRAAKETCRNLLHAYIKTRGIIDEKTHTFKPSFTTYWFRNRSLTLFKIQKTKDIISAIDNANSDEAIKTILQQAKSDKKAVQSFFHSGLDSTLSRCEQLLKPGA